MKQAWPDISGEGYINQFVAELNLENITLKLLSILMQ